jgi:2-dehydro-3-deoxygluconokinase
MSEIVTIGEPLVVWIPHEAGSFSEVKNFSKGVAGAELNVAIGATRLGHTVRYVTKIGADVTGKYIMDKLRSEGIETEDVGEDPLRLTGTYFKTKVASGDPQVYYMRRNSAASGISPADIEKVDFSETKILHVTGITAALSDSCYLACLRAVEKARKDNPNIMITFDPNLRPMLWSDAGTMIEKINRLAFLADVVLPGINEGKKLAQKDSVEEMADFYLEHGVKKAVVIKDGERGAWYKCANGDEDSIPGVHVGKIADTVGAGDAFATGVITGLLEGFSIAAAVMRGNVMGARMITVSGDNDALPTRQELKTFEVSHQVSRYIW